MTLIHPGLFPVNLSLPGDPSDETDRIKSECSKASEKMAAAHAIAAAEAQHQHSPKLANPPQSRSNDVCQRQAEAALQRIMSVLGDIAEPASSRDGVNHRSGSPAKPSMLQEVAQMSMESLEMAGTVLGLEMLSKNAKSISKSLKIISDKQMELVDQRVKDMIAQMEKAVEEQQKAKKAGIVGVVFDWVVAAVEVVSGVAKLVGGVMTGNVMTAAGGAMDLAAGIAGMVKATANTLALVDPNNAEEYKKIADVAGKVQMACEIAGAVIDVTSAARNMLVTKVIPKVAGKVMKEGAGEVMSAAIKAGSKEAIEGVAKSVAREVADQVASQIPQALVKQFSKEAIEQIVKKAVEKIGKEAIESGVELTAKEVSEAVTREVGKSVMRVAIKAAAYPAVQIARGVAGGVQQISLGVLNAQRAELNKAIRELAADIMLMDLLMSEWGQMKEKCEEEMKTIVDTHGKLIENQSNSSTQFHGTMIGVIAGAA